MALGWMLTGTSSLAATISWSGAGGDELWSNPANWIGGALPTSDDDVVINVPGAVTVRMDSPSTTIRSLQCEEGFVLENGPFTVTNGVSVVNGPFGMNPNYTLAATGPTTVFTVNGTATNVWALRVENGAVLLLPTVGELRFGPGYPYAEWSASGTGSTIRLTNLTHVAIEPGYKLDMNANGGGRIDAPRLQVPYGSLYVNAQGTDSLIEIGRAHV